MKTADLTQNGIYAFKSRTYYQPRPSLLLDMQLWTESDKLDNWDGSDKRTEKRIVRKADKGSKVGSSFSGGRWSYKYWRTGLPILVLNTDCWDFTEVADDRQITETAQSILERARDAMNVLGLVAEDSDGRPTDTTRRTVTLRVETVSGAARKIEVRLEFVRPQEIVSGWTDFVEQDARERAVKAALATSVAQREKETREQAEDFGARLTTLVGPKPSSYSATGRDDLRLKLNSSSTYEISASTLEQLLALAEKGATA